MIRIFLVSSLVLILCWSCARITGNIEGGPRDTFAPQLDTLGSSPGMQRNFEKQTLTFTFDEWIQLKNKNSILISPPLLKKPTIEVKGKELIFEFHEDEVLAEDATYVINFGESIVDFTEGNPLSNFRYVFSTGDEIDSLEIRGKIKDVQTREWLGDILVALYDNLQDSAILKERPLYVSKTNENGEFVLSNLREDTFRLFALEDNLNYKYDPPGERIAFYDSLIYLTDSFTTSLELDLFRMNDRRIQQVTHPRAQRLNVIYTEPADSLFIENKHLRPILQEWVNDSLYIWYERDSIIMDSSIVLRDRHDTILDTVQWRYQSKKDSLQLIRGAKTSFFKMKPKAEIAFRFNNPISLADTSNCTIMNPDSSFQNCTLRTTGRDLILSLHGKDTSTYEIRFFPGLVRDLYGQTIDTIQASVTTAAKEELGNINFNFLGGVDSISYHFSLQLGEEQIDNFVFTGEGQRPLLSLNPGKYEMVIFEDVNGNGIWDSGNWLERKQPEAFRKIPIEEVRANWDVEVLVDWNNLD